jgi:hypothetical protein
MTGGHACSYSAKSAKGTRKATHQGGDYRASPQCEDWRRVEALGVTSSHYNSEGERGHYFINMS